MWSHNCVKNQIILPLILQILCCWKTLFSSDPLTSLIVPFVSERLPDGELLFMEDPSNSSSYLDPLQSHPQISNIPRWTGNYLKVSQLDGFSHVHRKLFTPYRILSLILVNECTHSTSSILFELLTKNFGPLTRKDEDYYMFFLKNSKLLGEFVRSKFVKKIKFMLIFTLDHLYTEDHKLFGYSGIFFPFSFESPLRFRDLDFSERIPRIGEIFPDYLMDFGGRQIRYAIPTRLLLAVEIWRNPSTGVWDVKRGHQAATLLELSRVLNFTYRCFPSSFGGGTGFALPNGTWIGSTSDILYDRAEVGMVTGQIYARSKLFGFSTPFTYLRFIFTVGAPRPQYSWKAIIWPLTIDSWLGSLAISLIMGITLYFISRENLSQSMRSVGEKSWEISTIVLSILGSFLEQRFQPSNSNLIRMVIFCWLCFCLIISTAYRSKLVVFFTFPSVTDPPKTFDELVDSKFSWGMEGAGIGGSVYDNIKSSNNPVYVKLMKKMSLEPEPVQCFLKGLKFDFACLAYRSQTEFIFFRNFSTRSRRNTFYSAQEATFSPHASGWAFEKRAVFRHNFDSIINSLFALGVIAKWTQMDYEKVRADRIRWEMETETLPIFEDNLLDGPKALSNENLVGIFYMILFGSALSILGFLGEIFMGKMRFMACTSSNYPTGKGKDISSSKVRIIISSPDGIRQAEDRL